MKPLIYSRALVAKYAVQYGISTEEFCRRFIVIDPPPLRKRA